MPAAEAGLPRVAGFDVLRRLAVDATSDVLLARSRGPAGPERVVVLNVLVEPLRDEDEALRVLAREVEGYRRLSHPAVARLYDFLSDGGHRILVLEYVDGLPLHRLRALLKTHGRALPDQASVYIAWRVFSALAAAHGAQDAKTGRVRSVVHKDVNPSHVLVPWDGHVKLGDFGISAALHSGDRAESGLVQGIYGYSAPEQARGSAPSQRSDVYSSGLLLWELLAGRKAIVRGAGHEASVVAAVAKAEFPGLHELRPDLSKTLLQAVSRALEPDPDKRTIDSQSMCDVLRTLGNLEDGRVALVESLAVVRPPAVADMLFEAPARSKVPSELWLEPTRKVDVPLYVGGAGTTEADLVANAGEKANPVKEVPSTRPPARPDPPPSVVPSPMGLRPGRLPPRASENARPLPAPAAPSAPSSPPVRFSAPAPISMPAPTPVAPPVLPLEARPPQEPLRAPPLASSPGPSFVPLTPSPRPPVPSPMPEVGMPRRRMSPILWGVPVAVVVGAVVAARQPWRTSGSEAPMDRAASSQGVIPAVVVSVDRGGASGAPVRLAPPPAFTAWDASSASAPLEGDKVDGSRTPLRAGTGTVTVGAARSGHRVWIDERLMAEESPASYVVACGKHTVRVGSRGAPQALEIPCGADVEIK